MRYPSLGLGGIGHHVRIVAPCFPFSLEGECNKGLWLIYCLGYMLVLIILCICFGATLICLCIRLGLPLTLCGPFLSGMVAYGELD